jgi:hypothetical protein
MGGTVISRGRKQRPWTSLFQYVLYVGEWRRFQVSGSRWSPVPTENLFWVMALGIVAQSGQMIGFWSRKLSNEMGRDTRVNMSALFITSIAVAILCVVMAIIIERLSA